MQRFHWLMLVVCGFVCSAAWGQVESNVLLELEIVTPRQGANLVDAQRWGRFFQEQGEFVRIREPIAGDEVQATEQSRGTFRLVKVSAAMDREGKLRVPGHEFQLSNPGPIKDWLTEIKTFGAQGSPEGKPKWGLTNEQFKSVYEALSVPVESSLQGESLKVALETLKLPKAHPLSVHRDSQAAFDSVQGALIDDEVQGLSMGTALAGLLVQQGFGFRPLRTPTGSIELVVESVAEMEQSWPVGWEIERKPRNLISPKLFEVVPAGFQNVPLDDVLHAISIKQEIVVIVDRADCKAREIDLQALVSYPQKDRTAWALILESVVRQNRMDYELRRDEVGTPLVFIAPFRPKVAKPVE